MQLQSAQFVRMMRDHDVGPDLANHVGDRLDHLAGQQDLVVLEPERPDVVKPQNRSGLADLVHLLLDRLFEQSLDVEFLLELSLLIDELPMVGTRAGRQGYRGDLIALGCVMGQRPSRLIERIGGVRTDHEQSQGPTWHGMPP